MSSGAQKKAQEPVAVGLEMYMKMHTFHPTQGEVQFDCVSSRHLQGETSFVYSALQPGKTGAVINPLHVSSNL